MPHRTRCLRHQRRARLFAPLVISCTRPAKRSSSVRSPFGKVPHPHLNRHIHSYLQFYLALEAQFDLEFETDDDPCVLNWPNGYFGAASFQQIGGTCVSHRLAPRVGCGGNGAFVPAWKPETKSSHAQIYEADPLDVPTRTTTDYILSHLEPMPTSTTASHNTARNIGARFNVLPADIRNRILEDLLPFEDPSLECSRILTPYDWLRALLDKDEPIIPWLWDLDEEGEIISRVWDEEMMECLKKGQRFVQPEVLEWDWEKLVRQLAQTTVMCWGGADG